MQMTIMDLHLLISDLQRDFTSVYVSALAAWNCEH